MQWLKKLDPDDNQHDIYHEIDKDDDDGSDKKEEKPQPQTMEPNENERNVVINQTRIASELRRLQPFNNLGMLKIERENANLCFFAPENLYDYDTPKTFQEAWNHEDPAKQENWRQVI